MIDATPAGISTRPANPPARPLQPAPARRGTAGLSAGSAAKIKYTLPPASGRVSRESGPNCVARAIGWFSIGLGVAEVVAGRPIANCLGMERKANLIRAYGVREVVNGAGILAQSTPRQRARWMQARVAGDIADLATLSTGLSGDKRRLGRVVAAMGAVGAVLVIDGVCAALLNER